MSIKTYILSIPILRVPWPHNRFADPLKPQNLAYYGLDAKKARDFKETKNIKTITLVSTYLLIPFSIYSDELRPASAGPPPW